MRLKRDMRLRMRNTDGVVGTSTHSSYYDEHVLPYMDSAVTPPYEFLVGADFGILADEPLRGAYTMRGGKICTATPESNRGAHIMKEWRKLPIRPGRALVDTHSTPFLRGKKPDLAVVDEVLAARTAAAGLLATETSLIVPAEWKLEAVPSHDSEGQIIEYADITNYVQPCRDFTIALWHNGYNVKFYKVYDSWRFPDGKRRKRIQYTDILPTLEGNVGARLIARMLSAPDEALGVVHARVELGGRRFHLGGVIARGSTSTVFGMRDNAGADYDGAVFKLVRGVRIDDEVAALEAVRGIDGVVQLVGRVPAGSSEGLVLAPRCESEIEPHLVTIDVVVGLLRALERVHSKGFVHRDVRRRNVLLHAGIVVLGDFGSAVKLGVASRVGGTLETASDDVLRSWMDARERIFTAQDDIVSAVRTIFFLRHDACYRKFRTREGCASQLLFWTEMRTTYRWYAKWEAAAVDSAAAAISYISADGHEFI